MKRPCRSWRRGRSDASVYRRTADPPGVRVPYPRRPLLAAGVGLLLSGCVFHGPHATARLAPERHPLAGKQLSFTVAGGRPATARVVHDARLRHGAVRVHHPAGPAAPWLPVVAGAAVAAGDVLIDGPPSHRCERCHGLHPPSPGFRQEAAEAPASVSGCVPSAAGSRSG